jgi:hypothetical protein
LLIAAAEWPELARRWRPCDEALDLLGISRDFMKPARPAPRRMLERLLAALEENPELCAKLLEKIRPSQRHRMQEAVR